MKKIKEINKLTFMRVMKEIEIELPSLSSKVNFDYVCKILHIRVN